MVRVCTRCGESKPETLEFFSAGKRYRGGLRTWCRECHRAYKNENADRLREQYRQSKYGITVEEQRRLYASQDGRCASCDEPFTDSKRTHLDHDHETGVVRGYLCHWCNQTIGQARDSVERLIACARYLQRDLTWKEAA